MNNADRKRQLIAEGRVWRAEVLHAKETVREGFRPDSIARRVVGQVAVAGLAALRAKGGLGALGSIGFSGINLATVLPLAVKGVSALARHKSLVRPALRGAAIAGTVAAVAAFFFRRKARANETADQDADDMEVTASDA